MRRPVKLRIGGRWVAANALLDSGSDKTLVNPRLLEGGNVLLLPANPMAGAFEGAARVQPYGRCVRLMKMTDDWGVAKQQRIECVVADIEEDVILGLPWFRSVDPMIQWKHDHWNYPLSMDSLKITSSKKDIRRVARCARVAIALVQTINKEPEENEKGTQPLSDGASQATTLPSAYSDFADVFDPEAAAKLPPLDGRAHAIQLDPDKTPPWGPIYNLAAKELEVLREYIHNALEKGWIRRSTSPAGAPILFVPKKGGTLRLCVDYRALNQITRKDRAPLPLISEILDRLQGARVYTKLDLKDAYHRIRIREGDEWKTAFRCRYGHFEYQVMPFGLVNAPATFQEFINDVLRGLIDVTSIVYLDDILIYSSDVAKHQKHVREVLARLRQHGLYVNLSKCEFGTTTVGYLGFIITPEGIHMERRRTEEIAQWPLPTSVRDIQVFLGFTGFYRRFIKGYSKIAVPLTDLLKKERGMLQLDSGAVAAFEKLKSAFMEEPILVHFDPLAPTRVETDASDFAIGAILAQLHRGSWHPVAYISRKLSGPELRYTTPDAEMLAITEAFRNWRHYLAYSSQEIIVVTDHLNHSYLAGKKKLSSKQAGCLDELAPFHFRIDYRPGRLNPADGLSRRPDHFEEGASEAQRSSCLAAFQLRFSGEPAAILDWHSRQHAGGKVPTAIKQVACLRRATLLVEAARSQLGRRSTAATLPESLPTLEAALLEAQQGDAFGETKRALLGSIDEANGEMFDRSWIVGDDQLLRFKEKIFVPLGMRNEILMLLHDDLTAGHQGVSRTIRRIKQSYYWQGMRRDVKKYIKTCDLCQRTKARTHRPYGDLAALPIPNLPWQEISMDFITDLPKAKGAESKTYDSILVIVDRFTKYARYIPTTSKLTSDGLATIFLHTIFKDYGMPNGIVSDRGVIFTGSFWRTFCHLLACKRRLSVAFHPQTDGQTERQNQNLEHYLRAFCNKSQSDWPLQLPLAEFTYNTAQHSATGDAPATLLLGFVPRAPGQVQTDHLSANDSAQERVTRLQEMREAAKQLIRKSQAAYEKWYNRKRMQPPFKINDWVLVSAKNIKLKRPSKKLAPKYLGPYQIERISSSGLACQLRLPSSTRIHNVFNVTSLEPYHSRDATVEEPSDNPFAAEETFEVEKILSHKGSKKNRQYLVKWRGYDDEENSWLSYKDFIEKEIVREYENLSTSEIEATT